MCISDAYRQHWKVLNKGRAITDNIKRIRKDGSIIWLQGTYTSVLDNQGRVVEIIKIANDVTERILQSQEHEENLIRDVHHLSLTTDRSASQGAGEVINQVNIGMQDVVKLMTAFAQVKNQQPQA